MATIKRPLQNEAVRIWYAIQRMVDRQIGLRTDDCLRMKRLTVAVPPASGMIGVMQPHDSQIFSIPCAAVLSDMQIGDTVLVVFWHGLHNAYAIAPGDGQLH